MEGSLGFYSGCNTVFWEVRLFGTFSMWCFFTILGCCRFVYVGWWGGGLVGRGRRGDGTFDAD